MRLLVIGLAALASTAQVAVPTPLVEARRAYNEGRFDEAIALAESALSQPELANAAAVVLARARLERFRRSEPDAEDLERARAALTSVDVSRLDPREYVEYLIGLGESLYLDDPAQYSAAAEFFQTALIRAEDAEGLEPSARDVIFDWWAGALDRLAQLNPESDRRLVYERVLEGAIAHRARDDESAVAWYWLAVGARGVGNIERAWGAAVAAWIRAGALGERGAVLRHDVNQLVTQVILPERAARFAPADAKAALPMLQSQWDGIKARWGGGL